MRVYSVGNCFNNTTFYDYFEGSNVNRSVFVIYPNVFYQRRFNQGSNLTDMKLHYDVSLPFNANVVFHNVGSQTKNWYLIKWT